jgi:hypothetical protein
MAFNYQSEWEEQAAAPANPATGNWKIYFKSTGMFILEDDGTEHGPFNAGGVPAGELPPLMVSDGWPSSTNGSSAVTQVHFVTNNIDLMVAYFDQTTQEHFQWTVLMPDNWDGSTITFKVFWTATSGTPAETVEWNLQGRSHADSDAIDQVWGTAVEVSDALITASDVHISAVSGAVTITGAGAGEMVQLRLYRDVADTLAADAALIGIKVYYGTV